MKKPHDLPPFVRALDYVDDDLLAEVCNEPDAEEAARAVAQKRRMRRQAWTTWGAVAASCLFVLTGTLIGLSHLGAWPDDPTSPIETVPPPPYTPVSPTTIAVDINPSLELEIGTAGVVEAVRALNHDAETILAELTLDGQTAEDALDAVIDALVRHGYLTEDQNSILISVDNDDPAYAKQLQNDLSARVTARLGDANVDASVITQTYDKTPAADEGEGSSAAKVALAKKIFAASLPAAEGLTVERLCTLGIEELNAILGDQPYLVVDGIEVWREKYPAMITPQAALDIALGDCHIPKEQASKIYISLMHAKPMDTVFYVVRIFTPDKAYGYTLNGIGGVIADARSGYYPLEQAGPNSHIGTDYPLDEHLMERFVQIEGVIRRVLRDAEARGTAEEHHLVYTLETVEGYYVYRIRFDDGTLFYNYAVDVYTGKVRHKYVTPLENVD